MRSDVCIGCLRTKGGNNAFVLVYDGKCFAVLVRKRFGQSGGSASLFLYVPFFLNRLCMICVKKLCYFFKRF